MNDSDYELYFNWANTFSQHASLKLQQTPQQQQQQSQNSTSPFFANFVDNPSTQSATQQRSLNIAQATQMMTQAVEHYAHSLKLEPSFFPALSHFTKLLFPLVSLLTSHSPPLQQQQSHLSSPVFSPPHLTPTQNSYSAALVLMEALETYTSILKIVGASTDIVKYPRECQILVKATGLTPHVLLAAIEQAQAQSHTPHTHMQALAEAVQRSLQQHVVCK